MHKETYAGHDVVQSMPETCAIQIRRGAKQRGPKPLYAPLIGDDDAIKSIVQGSLFIADVALHKNRELTVVSASEDPQRILRTSDGSLYPGKPCLILYMTV